MQLSYELEWKISKHFTNISRKTLNTIRVLARFRMLPLICNMYGFLAYAPAALKPFEACTCKSMPTFYWPKYKQYRNRCQYQATESRFTGPQIFCALTKKKLKFISFLTNTSKYLLDLDKKNSASSQLYSLATGF